MKLSILELGAFETLYYIEGMTWEREVKRGQYGPHNFFVIQQSILDAIMEHGNLPDMSLPDIMADAVPERVIYGLGGFSRYIVQANTEIVPDWSSFTPETEILARAQEVFSNED